MKQFNTGVVIVNCETPNLTTRAVNSIKDYCEVLVVDNSIINLYKGAQIINRKNAFHGPALDQGIKALDTEYIIVMDSDAELLNPSILVEMKTILADPDVYAVGHSVEKVPKNSRYKIAFDYLRPYFAMFKKQTYLQYPPFVHHGAPWWKTMVHISGNKRVVELSGNYVHHDGAATRKKVGRQWYKGWTV